MNPLYKIGGFCYYTIKVMFIQGGFVVFERDYNSMTHFEIINDIQHKYKICDLGGFTILKHLLKLKQYRTAFYLLKHSKYMNFNGDRYLYFLHMR